MTEIVAGPIRLAHADAVPLAVVRRRVPRSDLGRVVPEGCGVVWNVVRAHGITAGRHVALYLNALIELEVGVEVEGSFDEHGEVVRSCTPAGPVATAIHYGPYQTLGTTHDAIRAWCAARGHQLAGPNWEIYGHWQSQWHDDPSGIRTDVYYQLAAVAPEGPRSAG